METACPGIDVCGWGAVTALGVGVQPLAEAIPTNASGLRPAQRLAGKGYQSAVAGWVADEVWEQLRAQDETHRDAAAFLLARAALKEATLNAAAFLAPIPLPRRALVLATTKADVAALERVFRKQPCSPTAFRHIQPGLLAIDLAQGMHIAGPVQCVSAACISGLLALQQGASLIHRGQADLVFVVGVDLLSHFVLAGFSTLKALDPEGCRPFDRARIGLSLGEGSGAVVLVRAKRAASANGSTAGSASLGPDSRPRFRLAGWGTSNDANHLTGPSRDGSGLALAIHRALARAHCDPREIDYIHLHGTGTPYNDAMEALALRSVFKEHVPPFSSSKGMLGHTLGAAGVIETILCGLAVHTQTLPGTPRLRERDPVVPDSLVARPRATGPLRRVLKVNCGFGGTNAALVLDTGLI